MKKQFLILVAMCAAASPFAFSSDLDQEDNTPKDCREVIVASYTSVGESIDANSFSNTSFEQLNISIEDFNLMSSQEQDAIYKRVKPIEVMVEETIKKLSRYIDRYVGTFYEVYLLDELTAWRSNRDALRICTK